MEPLRLDPVPARVVAWHNRHPLARRVTAAHVGSLGYVALPFVQDGKRLKRGFAEDFLEGVSPAAIGRWAARHGQALPEVPADGPLRVVNAGELPGAPLVLYVRTAFIDDGTHQTRVLVGSGERPSVLGRRLWSRPRVGAAGGVGAALGALAAVLAWPAAPPAAPVVALAGPAASAPDSAAVHAEAPPAGASHAAAPPAAASRPVDVDPQWGTIELPFAKPRLRQAPEVELPPRPAPPAEAPVVAQAPSPAPAASAPPVRPTRMRQLPPQAIVQPAPQVYVRPPPQASAPPAAPPRAQPVWALSTPPFRSEIESERASVTIAALFQRAGLRSVRVEALQLQGRWIVVGLPFPTRDAAENAQHLLATRGVRTEPIEF